MARLAFYYGWTHEYMMGLEYGVFYKYALSLDAIIADKALFDVNLHAFTDMKKDAKKSFLRKLKAQVDKILNRSDGKLATYADIVSKLKTAGVKKDG